MENGQSTSTLKPSYQTSLTLSELTDLGWSQSVSYDVNLGPQESPVLPMFFPSSSSPTNIGRTQANIQAFVLALWLLSWPREHSSIDVNFMLRACPLTPPLLVRKIFSRTRALFLQVWLVSYAGMWNLTLKIEVLFLFQVTFQHYESTH